MMQKVNVPFQSTWKWRDKQIYDVLYILDLEENLLSVGQLMENGYSLVFRDNYCKIY